MSDAFLLAVAACAGFQSACPRPDTDGTDWTIAAPGALGTTRSPKLDVQIKGHLSQPPTEGFVNYPLKQRNYDLLIGDDWHVPRILVVMIQPNDIVDWLTVSDEQLVVRHCAYWVSLRDHQPNDNRTTTTVEIPCQQRFDPPGLSAIMDRIGTGGLP